jgi:hypothetical protein
MTGASRSGLKHRFLLCLYDTDRRRNRLYIPFGIADKKTPTSFGGCFAYC